MITKPFQSLNRELLDEALLAFRTKPVTPDTRIEQVMYDAGAMKALMWLDAKLKAKQHQTTVTSPDEEVDPLPDRVESFLRRVSKGSTA